MAELIDFYASRAAVVCTVLKDTGWMLATKAVGSGMSDTLGQNLITECAELFRKAAQLCAELGLISPLDAIDRTLRSIGKHETEPLTLGDMANALHDVQMRLFDELKRRKFYYLDPQHLAYFVEAHEILSPAALDRFPSSSRDVEEAAKCFAMSRYTACVFHLMRVTEHGMDALAFELGVASNYKTWDNKINNMVSVLAEEERKPYGTSQFAGQMEFFRQATERLTAVQHALRNETMHSRSHYSQDEASDIYRSVLRFMEQLAAHLPAPSVP